MVVLIFFVRGGMSEILRSSLPLFFFFFNEIIFSFLLFLFFLFFLKWKFFYKQNRIIISFKRGRNLILPQRKFLRTAHHALLPLWHCHLKFALALHSRFRANRITFFDPISLRASCPAKQANPALYSSGGKFFSKFRDIRRSFNSKFQFPVNTALSSHGYLNTKFPALCT